MKPLPVFVWFVVVLTLVIGGALQIQDAWNHVGDGVVTYARSPHGEGEREVAVSEPSYKRQHYAMGGLMLGIGVVALGYGIKDLRSSPPPL